MSCGRAQLWLRRVGRDGVLCVSQLELYPWNVLVFVRGCLSETWVVSP